MFSRTKSSVALAHFALVALLLGTLASFLAGVGVSQAQSSGNTTGLPLALPDGFGISVFARGLGHPSMLAWDGRGNMLVSSTENGKILAIRDSNRDGIADAVKVVADGLDRPAEMAVKCDGDSSAAYLNSTDGVIVGDSSTCRLYVATATSFISFYYQTDTMSANGETVIARTEPQNGGLFAQTALADNRGYCAGPETASSSQPVIAMFCGSAGAAPADPHHLGQLGSVTVPANGWPQQYRGNILSARPEMHDIVRYVIDPNGQVAGPLQFISGWKTGTGRILGAPAALLSGPNHGSYISDLYVADEATGTIYRVSYHGQNAMMAKKPSL